MSAGPPSPHRRRFLLRSSTLLAALVSTALVLSSCSSLLGMDDYHDSVGELCDLLERCYQEKNCDSRLTASLAAASAIDRSEWLSAVTVQECLLQCSKARKCLTIPPVCAPLGSSCQDKSECCGFLTGTSNCLAPSSASSPSSDAGTGSDAGGGGADAGTSAAQVCCKADGAPCTDGDPNHQCCAGNCRNNLCGGVACRPAAAPCQDDFQCCSGVCRDGSCAEDICLELGRPCDPTLDACCQGECTARGVCEYPQACRPLQEPCDALAPLDSADGCCAKDPGSGKDLECVPLASPPTTADTPTFANPGVCLEKGTTICAPVGDDCTTTKCCPGLECSLAYKKCGAACLGTDAACQFNEDCCSGACQGGKCTCSNTYCSSTQNDPTGGCCPVSVGGETLPTTCLGGVCLAACASGGCSHDECVEGAPMNASACALDPSKADPKKSQLVPPKDIVKFVCQADPFCCCTAWDSVCVNAAVAKYGVDACT